MEDKIDHCAYPKCGKELTHIEGRKKKKYCDQSCNTRHWQMLNPKYIPKTRRIPVSDNVVIELPKDYLSSDKVYQWIDGKLTEIEQKTEMAVNAATSVKELAKDIKEVKNNISSMPIRKKGEDSFDFAQRKNEWKKKHNQ